MPNKAGKKSHPALGEGPGAPATPAALLSRVSRPPRGAQAVREVRLRLPDAVVEQLRALSHHERCSMNALVADYLDRGFRREGHKGIDELAPGFADYLRGDRKLGTEAAARDAEQSDFEDQSEGTAILPVKFT